MVPREGTNNKVGHLRLHRLSLLLRLFLQHVGMGVSHVGLPERDWFRVVRACVQPRNVLVWRRLLLDCFNVYARADLVHSEDWQASQFTALSYPRGFLAGNDLPTCIQALARSSIFLDALVQVRLLCLERIGIDLLIVWHCAAQHF